MSGITGYVSKKSREENVIDHFNKMCGKVKTKEEIRKIEMRLLKPKPIQKYHGKKTGMTAFQKKSLLLVFKSQNSIEELSKIIKISSYITNNTYDVDIILELVHLINTNRLEWDNKKKKFYLNTKDGRRLKI